MAKEKEIQFSIKAFSIKNFSSLSPDKTVRKDRLDYQIQHQFELDISKKLIAVKFWIDVYHGKNNPLELASIATETAFKLKGVDDEEMKRLPEDLYTTFLSIAYSNTRGALAAEAQGTVAGEVPLPLINPRQVIEEMKKQAEPEKEN